MQVLRSKIYRVSFVILAGLAFVNLSFILADMRMLDFNQDHPLYTVVSTLGEEEQEQETPSGEKNSVKEVDVAAGQLSLYHASISEVAAHQNKHNGDLAIIAGHKRIFSPPPERA